MFLCGGCAVISILSAVKLECLFPPPAARTVIIKCSALSSLLILSLRCSGPWEWWLNIRFLFLFQSLKLSPRNIWVPPLQSSEGNLGGWGAGEVVLLEKEMQASPGVPGGEVWEVGCCSVFCFFFKHRDPAKEGRCQMRLRQVRC